MTAVDLPEDLVRYLADRDRQHHHAVVETLAAMTDREQLLVREAAVMGFVQGQRAGTGAGTPRDSVILARVIDAALAMPDLYPTISHLRRYAERAGGVAP